MKTKPTQAQVQKMLNTFENQAKETIGNSGAYAYTAGYYSSIITYLLTNSKDSETVNSVMRQLKNAKV
jgi:hypothetical protein